MKLVSFYSEENIENILNKRAGEVKFGEGIEIARNWESLENSKAKYVLLGIPEDIGVRANHGRDGSKTAWKEALATLCNVQKNQFTKPENVLILGEINCEDEMSHAEIIPKENPNYAEKLGSLVSEIDKKVSETIQKIIALGKFPIVIGGGHNNSYGNIKGASQALKTPINCINFDAHTDFRTLEHRHSGNGFSYAFEENVLDHYFIFGLHRNYTSQAVFDRMEELKDRVKFNLFEAIEVQGTLSFKEAMQQAETFCCDTHFGLELDMDAIEGMGSSAMTPSGFTMTQARQFTHHFAKNSNCAYVHICEGNSTYQPFAPQVAKAIAYLITDVISE